MAGSLVCLFRSAVSSQRSLLKSKARRKFRLQLESPEARQMLHGSPHGIGTLADEHEAVMDLIAFETIHQTASNPVYFVARDGDADPLTPNLWSDVKNWLQSAYDVTTKAFVTSPAMHLPTTGDDVEIPEGLGFVYDISPESFNIPALPSLDPAKTSVKNNLRLHTVGVEGSLSFQSNKDLLMVFETMVVATSGSLSINEDTVDL